MMYYLRGWYPEHAPIAGGQTGAITQNVDTLRRRYTVWGAKELRCHHGLLLCVEAVADSSPLRRD